MGRQNAPGFGGYCQSSHCAWRCPAGQSRHLWLVVWRLCGVCSDGFCTGGIRLWHFHVRPRRSGSSVQAPLHYGALLAAAHRQPGCSGRIGVDTPAFSDQLHQTNQKSPAHQPRQLRRTGAPKPVRQHGQSAESCGERRNLLLLSGRRPRLCAT